MKKYVNFFADLCLQDYGFQQYKPSHLSVAIIIASRRALQINPLWRPEIEFLTKTSEAEITPVLNHVWEYYKFNFPTGQKNDDSPQSATEV